MMNLIGSNETEVYRDLEGSARNSRTRWASVLMVVSLKLSVSTLVVGIHPYSLVKTKFFISLYFLKVQFTEGLAVGMLICSRVQSHHQRKRTPIDIATAKGHTEVLRLLLGEGTETSQVQVGFNYSICVIYPISIDVRIGHKYHWCPVTVLHLANSAKHTQRFGCYSLIRMISLLFFFKRLMHTTLFLMFAIFIIAGFMYWELKTVYVCFF